VRKASVGLGRSALMKRRGSSAKGESGQEAFQNRKLPKKWRSFVNSLLDYAFIEVRGERQKRRSLICTDVTTPGKWQELFSEGTE